MLGVDSMGGGELRTPFLVGWRRRFAEAGLLVRDATCRSGRVRRRAAAAGGAGEGCEGCEMRSSALRQTCAGAVVLGGHLWWRQASMRRLRRLNLWRALLPLIHCIHPKTRTVACAAFSGVAGLQPCLCMGRRIRFGSEAELTAAVERIPARTEVVLLLVRA